MSHRLQIDLIIIGSNSLNSALVFINFLSSSGFDVLQVVWPLEREGSIQVT